MVTCNVNKKLHLNSTKKKLNIIKYVQSVPPNQKGFWKKNKNFRSPYQLGKIAREREM